MKLIFTLLSLLCTSLMYGQRQFVVIDIETSTPLRDVVVNCGADTVAVTKWDGTFVLDSVSDILAFHKEGYEHRRIMPEELTDTIPLLPSLHRIDEVVIYGQRGLNRTMNFGMTSDMLQLPAPSTGGSYSFDFFKLIDFKGRKRARYREKLKKILDAY